MAKTLEEYKSELQGFLALWDSLTQEYAQEVQKNSKRIILDSGTGQIIWRAGFYEGKRRMLQDIAEHFDLDIPSLRNGTN